MRVWFFLAALYVLNSCAIYEYPGQPGMKTNDFSKLEHESLDEMGLWTTNVFYDNSEGGKGMIAIVTYLFPAAETFTSNVRTNADGTLYRFKTNPNGGVVQAISLPSENTVIIPEDSVVFMLIGYDTSMDEVDDKNLPEENIFSSGLHGASKKTKKAIQFLKTRFEWLKAGTFTKEADLSYDVESISLGEKVLQFPQSIKIKTNVLGTASQKSIDQNTKKQMAEFVETNFPHGYSGVVKFQLRGSAQPLELPLKVQTPKTLQALGVNVKRVSAVDAEKLVRSFSKNSSEAK